MRGWFLIVLIFYYVNDAFSIRWLSLQHSNLKWTLNQESSGRGIRSGYRSACSVARRRYGLAKMQTKLCRTSVEVMPHIQHAAKLAAQTCKSTFRSRRWNCSSIDTAPHLTPDLTRATREQAFVYAVGSAALTYTIAKACATGHIHHCTCASPPKSSPEGNFKWGGCGDNIKWGMSFAKRFVDASERYSVKRTKHKTETTVAYVDKILRKSKSHSAVVNLHNNRVGRKVISENLSMQCKCHGVSGSCSVKTCWKSLPTMNEIGTKLLRKFTIAKEISKTNLNLDDLNLPDVPGKRLPGAEQLIYLNKSPDYCTKDARLGSFGTVGRKCNVTSNGTDSCRQLCCGRGYKTVVEEKVERCQCKYHYCCYVTCKTCKSVMQRHECG